MFVCTVAQHIGVAADPSAAIVLHCLAHAVLLLDPHLQVVMANRAASTLFRTPADRLRGLPVHALIPHPELPSVLRDFHSGSTKVIETTLPSARRGRLPIVLRISATRVAISAADLSVPRTSVDPREFRLLVLEDVSDKAVLEQQLVDTEKQAAIGQLAAGILHEVNNPLASIGSNLLFIQKAVGESAPPAVVQALDVTLEQLVQMRQLLGTLSGVPGHVPPRFETADLHDVVRRCVTFIAMEAERRRIRLAVAFAPRALVCDMDVRITKQVLLNLFKNAMEAMPDGGRLEVRTWYREASRDDEPGVVVEISDTGVGILESDMRKVFRPLYSTKPRGAGLGLSFCRQAVEEHGGEIRLRPRTGARGTVATFSLPVRQTEMGCE
jgi:signal transduction histidine kinase